VSHKIHADPEKLRRLADAELDSSKELSTVRQHFDEATWFDSSLKKFGNLAWSDTFGTDAKAAADDAQAAIGALAGALTRNVAALHRTASNYEMLDARTINDDLGLLGHYLRDLFD